MQAIITTFVNDADNKPHITAACMGKSVSLPYDRELSLDDNHVAAAMRLAITMNWSRSWTYGRLPSGDYCHVAEVGQRQFTTIKPETVASLPNERPRWQRYPSPA